MSDNSLNASQISLRCTATDRMCALAGAVLCHEHKQYACCLITLQPVSCQRFISTSASVPVPVSIHVPIDAQVQCTVMT